jgi:hypothetical protein
MYIRSIHVVIDTIFFSLVAMIYTCLAVPSVTGKHHREIEPAIEHLFPWQEKSI